MPSLMLGLSACLSSDGGLGRSSRRRLGHCEYAGRHQLLVSVLVGTVILVLQVPSGRASDLPVPWRRSTAGARCPEPSARSHAARDRAAGAAGSSDKAWPYSTDWSGRLREEGLTRADIEPTLKNKLTVQMIIDASSVRRLIELLDIPKTGQMRNNRPSILQWRPARAAARICSSATIWASPSSPGSSSLPADTQRAKWSTIAVYWSIGSNSRSARSLRTAVGILFGARFE